MCGGGEGGGSQVRSDCVQMLSIDVALKEVKEVSSREADSSKGPATHIIYPTFVLTAATATAILAHTASHTIQ